MMDDNEINTLKRRHNSLLKHGQDLLRELNETADEIVRLRGVIPTDADDEIRFIFGAGYEVDE